MVFKCITWSCILPRIHIGIFLSLPPEILWRWAELNPGLSARKTSALPLSLVGAWSCIQKAILLHWCSWRYPEILGCISLIRHLCWIFWKAWAGKSSQLEGLRGGALKGIIIHLQQLLIPLTWFVCFLPPAPSFSWPSTIFLHLFMSCFRASQKHLVVGHCGNRMVG